MFDHEKIKQGVRMILEGVGEDPGREGLVETPDRVARMYEEIFSGLYMDAAEPLAKRFHVAVMKWYWKRISYSIVPANII